MISNRDVAAAGVCTRDNPCNIITCMNNPSDLPFVVNTVITFLPCNEPIAMNLRITANAIIEILVVDSTITENTTIVTEPPYTVTIMVTFIPTNNGVIFGVSWCLASWIKL